MMITKCDLCKKEVSRDKEEVYIRIGFSAVAELCGECAIPILKFLKKNMVYRNEFDKLETRVGNIENVLAMPKKN